MSILPAFIDHPVEAALIGRLLAGYGELEFQLLALLGPVLGGASTAAKVLFRTRGEEQRILIADAMIRDKIFDQPLRGRYEEIIAGMQHCRKIRNQYAHAQWMEYKGVLCMNLLEDGAKTNAPMMMVQMLRVTLELLQHQENYYEFIEEGFGHVVTQYRQKAGLTSSPLLPWPTVVQRPALHSGPC